MTGRLVAARFDGGCRRVLDVDVDVPVAKQVQMPGHHHKNDRDDYDQRPDDEVKPAIPA